MPLRADPSRSAPPKFTLAAACRPHRSCASHTCGQQHTWTILRMMKSWCGASSLPAARHTLPTDDGIFRRRTEGVHFRFKFPAYQGQGRPDCPTPSPWPLFACDVPLPYPSLIRPRMPAFAKVLRMGTATAEKNWHRMTVQLPHHGGGHGLMPKEHCCVLLGLEHLSRVAGAAT
jgi:hypothetical protein